MIKLIQGDCLEKMQDIEDGSIGLILTDPPYGTTACKWDSIIPLEPMWKQLKRIIKKNGAIVMIASQPFTTKLISSNYEMFKYCWVWDKKQHANFASAKYQPLKIHEDVVVFGSGSGSYKPITTKGKNRSKGGRKEKAGVFGMISGEKYENNIYYPKSIIEISNAKKTGLVHPTQKPIPLMEYLIKTYTNENETVLDFTMGSGTTGVAACNLNRSFIGIELDPNYFKIATDRINAADAQTSF